MWGFVRLAFAILVLPFSVTVLIPIWIARRSPPLWPPVSWIDWVLVAAALPVLLAAVSLFVSCVSRFWREGRGTLAPWDPPRSLVVTGPYAHVRNPMISGVILILIAEAMLLRSPPHAVWAGVFFLACALIIPLAEEPLLEARFGEVYEEYRRKVPGLIPRIRPYRPGKMPPQSSVQLECPDPLDRSRTGNQEDER